MVDYIAADFKLKSVYEDHLPDYITGLAMCPYTPPTGYKSSTVSSGTGEGLCTVKVELLSPSDSIVERTGSPAGDECTPVASGTGVQPICYGTDEYQCIDGKITLVKEKSTACGYQEGASENGNQTPTASPWIGVGLIAVAVAAFAALALADDTRAKGGGGDVIV